MRTKLTVSVLLSLIILLLFAIIVSADTTPLPHAFYGTAKVGTSNISTSTIVTAKIGGVTRGSYTMVTSGYYGHGCEVGPNCPDNSKLVVSNSSSTAITFQIGGKDTGETYTWSEGGITNLDLSLDSGTSYCGDGTCNSDESTTNCSVECVTAAAAAAGGAGGGGGVAGGAAVAAPAAKAAETISLASIAKGGTGSFKFKKSADLGIYEISVLVKSAATSPSITVKESSLPEGTTPAIIAADGAVYKYLEITSSISNPNIDKVTIRFKVTRKWVKDNNIDVDTIALKKYENFGWTKLKTTRINEDPDYYFFETEANGFSLYAITGEKVKVTPPEVKPPEVKPPEERPPTLPEVIKKINWTGVIIVLLMVIAGLMGYLFYTRRKKRSKV